MNFQSILSGALVTLTATFTSFSVPETPHRVVAKAEAIHWLTIKEAEKLQLMKPKKLYFDVYTSWCGWCKRMDQESYHSPKVISAMNEHYYAIKFDAESKDSVIFEKRAFKFLPAHKVHEFAYALLNGQMGYPTTVIFNEEGKLISRVPGYLASEPLSEILMYFGNNLHMKTSWNRYQKSLGHDTLGARP